MILSSAISRARSGAIPDNLDKAEIPWNGPTRGYVSLWDVINFSVHKFLLARGLIEQACGLFAMLANKKSDLVISDGYKDKFLADMDFSLRCLDEIQLTSSRICMERIIRYTNQGMTLVVLNIELKALLDTIEEEVKIRTFCYVPQKYRNELISLDGKWSSIWEKFPSTKPDSTAATECYALQLPVAAIYHCMLVLEKGIAALARALDVPRGNRDWGTLLARIEEKIAAKRREAAVTARGTNPPSPRVAKARAARLDLYSEAGKEFSYFKDVWRNHTMHGRGQYDEHDAAKVLDHVREFMAILARKLREVP